MEDDDVRDDVEVAAIVTPLLQESWELGFLGPGPVQEHINHALHISRVVRDFVSRGDRIIDLGSGGGVPGLVVAAQLPHCNVVLMDSQRRRCEFLERAVEHIPTAGPVTIANGRAEVLARSSEYETSARVIVARSFGPPAVVAECASRMLEEQAVLIVSEPPGSDPARWPPSGLSLLGLESIAVVTDPISLRVLRRVSQPMDAKYPRRDGVPSRKPLW